MWAAEKGRKGKPFAGEAVFKLYDTYGFPLELTEEILKEEGCRADVDGFNEHMKRQREMARAGRKAADEEGWKEAVSAVDVPETRFTGYDHLEDDGVVLAVYVDGKKADCAKTYQNAVIYLDKTPFLCRRRRTSFRQWFYVNRQLSCQKLPRWKKSHGIYAHKVLIEKGTLKTGDTVQCGVNIFKRNSAARNHTATHLLQKALQEVVGSHVQQAGSSVK